MNWQAWILLVIAFLALILLIRAQARPRQKPKNDISKKNLDRYSESLDGRMKGSS